MLVEDQTPKSVYSDQSFVYLIIYNRFQIGLRKIIYTVGFLCKQMKGHKLIKITDKRPNELLAGQLPVPVTQVNMWRMMQGSGMGQGKHQQDRDGAIKQPLTEGTLSDQL